MLASTAQKVACRILVLKAAIYLSTTFLVHLALRMGCSGPNGLTCSIYPCSALASNDVEIPGCWESLADDHNLCGSEASVLSLGGFDEANANEAADMENFPCVSMI